MWHPILQKFMIMNKANFTLCIFLFALALMLSACEEKNIAVSLHGVNYSNNTFSFSVADVDNPELITGGEKVIRFSSGGTTCCAVIPRKWKAGIKLKIRTIYWQKLSQNEKLSEISQMHFVELPPYPDGEPGDLWVLRTAEGKIDIISSDFQPDHPKWPGAVKGWPVPSIEYMRERWEQIRKIKQGNVDLYVRLLNQLENEPEKHAKDAWEYAKKNGDKSLANFSGSNDPKYLNQLRVEYSLGLKDSEGELREILENKP